MSDEKRAWLTEISERLEKGYVDEDGDEMKFGHAYPKAASDMERLLEFAASSSQGTLIELVQEVRELKIYNFGNDAPPDPGYEVDVHLHLDPPGSRLKICQSAPTLAEAVEECLLYVRHMKAMER